jgi:arylsulfatase
MKISVDFLKVLGGFSAAALASGVNPLAAANAARPLAGQKPNIILILTDDQGYGDLGRNGNPVLKTPNLDRMYDEGIHFEDFHVSPSCAPTRSCLMTGMHEFKNGITHTIFERDRLSLSARTVADVLKGAGYATGIFGKWHLGDEAEYQPHRRGFDEVFIHGGGGIGQTHRGSLGDAPGNTYFNPAILHNGTFVKTQGYCTDVFFAQAMRWMDQQRQRHRPFFAYLATNAPHSPYIAKPEDKAIYADQGLAENVQSFLGMIHNIDQNVGALRAQLAAWGIERETLIVYMNDNGGTLGTGIHNAGMRGSKGSPHNGGTRAMSLWCWPGTIQPAACDHLTAHLDFMPTCAELAGVELPAELQKKLDGFSLVPLLCDPKAKWHEERMLVTHIGRWGLGKEPAKYGEKGNDCSIRWKNFLQVRSGAAWQLFDLKADPGQKKNIAEASGELVKKLDAYYDSWWHAVVPCLVNEEAYKTAPQINPFKEQYCKQFGLPLPKMKAVK